MRIFAKNLRSILTVPPCSQAKIEAEKKRKTKNKLALATRLRTMQFKDGGDDVEDGGANSDGNPIYDTEDRNTFEEEGAGASSGGVPS